jgi:hypothetical protein
MEQSPRPRRTGTRAPAPERRLALCAGSPGGASAKRDGERGAGNLKAIVWTVILVAFIYCAVMVLPVLISEYEFQDSLQEIARFASVNRRSPEQVRQSVLDEAQKEDLPVTAENIKVDGYAGNIHINVEYSVTVDLKVYQWTFNFHPDANNAALL